MNENRTEDAALLIALLEAATEGSRELDAAIWNVLHPHAQVTSLPAGHWPFSTSLDAALTLVPKDWSWHSGRDRRGGRERYGYSAELAEPMQTEFGPGVGVRSQIYDAPTAALAMCLACLRAILATESGALKSLQTVTAENPAACDEAKPNPYTAGLATQREGERKVLERGWRTFWGAFSDYLRLGYEQRTYGWHDIIDAEGKGIAAVNRLATDSVLQPEAEASRHSTSDTFGPDPVTDRNRPA